MATATAARHASGDRASLYQEITDKIIAELEQDRVPWVQPWGSVGLTRLRHCVARTRGKHLIPLAIGSDQPDL
jgi:antirestriction protein ArdC